MLRKPYKRRKRTAKAQYYIFSVYLPKDLYKKLNKIGVKRKVNNGQIIRELIFKTKG